MPKFIYSAGVSFIIMLTCISTSVAQIFPKKVYLADERSTSIILVPDTQNYVKFDINQPLLTLMMRWIAGNIEQLNIAAVANTGDLVEHNDHFLPEAENGNQTSKQQWEAVSTAYTELDHKVPYVLCAGNHDYGQVNAETRDSHFSDYFGVERNALIRKHLVDVFKKEGNSTSLENAAYELELPNWDKLLFISLEFAPRDEVLAWARELAAGSRFAGHKVVVLTHSYLRWDGLRIEKEDYKMPGANYGEAIYKKLIYPSPNIRLVICGHYCQIGDFEHNVGQRTDQNVAGKSVFQMMWNAQTAGGGWHGNGGDGWLRILEFKPDGKTIGVCTFSPVFGISPTTEQFAWRTAPYDQFDIVIQ